MSQERYHKSTFMKSSAINWSKISFLCRGTVVVKFVPQKTVLLFVFSDWNQTNMRTFMSNCRRYMDDTVKTWQTRRYKQADNIIGPGRQATQPWQSTTRATQWPWDRVRVSYLRLEGWGCNSRPGQTRNLPARHSVCRTGTGELDLDRLIYKRVVIKRLMWWNKIHK